MKRLISLLAISMIATILQTTGGWTQQACCEFVNPQPNAAANTTPITYTNEGSFLQNMFEEVTSVVTIGSSGAPSNINNGTSPDTSQFGAVANEFQANMSGNTNFGLEQSLSHDIASTFTLFGGVVTGDFLLTNTAMGNSANIGANSGSTLFLNVVQRFESRQCPANQTWATNPTTRTQGCVANTVLNPPAPVRVDPLADTMINAASISGKLDIGNTSLHNRLVITAAGANIRGRVHQEGGAVTTSRITINVPDLNGGFNLRSTATGNYLSVSNVEATTTTTN